MSTHRGIAVLGLALILASSAFLASPASAGGSGGDDASLPPLFFTGSPNAAEFRAHCDRELEKAQRALDRLLAVKSARTIENTLDAFNEAALHADNAAYQAGLLENAHPDSAFRSTAEEISQKAIKFLTDLSLNRDVYHAVKGVDVSRADATTKYFVEKTLRDYRRSGVDQDEETRKRIAGIQEELVVISQEFYRNIRNDSRTIQVKPEELEGLPEDYMKAHPPGENGLITISIEYPDRTPVMKYAKNGDVRHRITIERMNRAHPTNMNVLAKMFEKRHELATLLGYANWADYVTEDKMIRSSRRAAEFIDRLGKLVRDQVKRDYALTLARKREDDPAATEVHVWEAAYYENLIQQRDYNFNALEARPYFPFRQVKQGVFGVTSRLFGVAFKRIENADVWHASVEAYELWEGKKLLGRFFLDLHPRAGKYNHAAKFGIRAGAAGRQLPEAALVCNFPGGIDGDPGLMEQSDVETFFHEFGHLLHHIFGGQGRWEGLAGTSTERDFVEAPSQMLEEWCRDANTLQTFAKHYETGQPIPTEMVERRNKADTFGRGVNTAYQIYLAAVSLNVYNRPPEQVDSDAIVRKYYEEYIPYPWMDDTHFQCSFGHLDGYSAVYYTYQWSLVIAKDFFSQFDRKNLLAPGVAKRYRDKVLSPGGSKPAEQLVRDFLNRDLDFTAYEAWVRGADRLE